jgi:hypothetical protein
VKGAVNVLATTPLWVVNSRMKMQGAKMRKVGPVVDDEANKGHAVNSGPHTYEEVQLKYKNIFRECSLIQTMDYGHED